jgi:YD repeat-containing protein
LQVRNPWSCVATYLYDPAGKLRRVDRANGTYTLYGYNSRELPTSIEHRKSNGDLLGQFDYGYLNSSNTYDPRGLLQTETDHLGQVHRFTYDGLGQMAAESHPDFAASANLYDLNGNRTRKRGE